MRLRQSIFLCLGLTLSIPIHGYAADPWQTQEQLDRARAAQEAREERLGEGRIEWQALPSTIEQDGSQRRPVIGTQLLTPSFYIAHIRIAEEHVNPPMSLRVTKEELSHLVDRAVLVNNSSPESTRLIRGPLAAESKRESIVLDIPQEFSFFKKIVKPYVNRKVSIDDVNELSTKLNNELIARGYVTSKIGIPPQSLATGQLQLNLQLGRIESIQYAEGAPHLPWQNAFPLRAGDVLNIRDIEQGLEQMRRLSSQSATVELEAGSRPLYSVIVLQTVKKPPIRGMIALDDSGLKDTGKLQRTAVISADRVFNANDVLQVSVNRDGARDGEVKGTKNHSVFYSIPRGKDTFSVSYSHMNYHQTVNAMPTSFKSTSTINYFKASWNHVFHRDRMTRRSLEIAFSKRNSKNYINDVEIGVQRGNTAAIEIGISERRYIKRNTLYSRVSFKKGVGWFGSQPEYGNGAPSTRFTQVNLDVDYQVPRTWGHRLGSFTSSFHGQWTTGGKRLFSRDMMSIGNRYTVQGFDGEHTLMAESGWYVRNEVATYIPQWKSSVYINIDFGAVYGPSTDVLTGKFIAGTSLGMRGQFDSGLFYDGFIGIPLYKPEGYKTDRVVTGFQAGVRF